MERSRYCLIERPELVIMIRLSEFLFVTIQYKHFRIMVRVFPPTLNVTCVWLGQFRRVLTQLHINMNAKMNGKFEANYTGGAGASDSFFDANVRLNTCLQVVPS